MQTRFTLPTDTTIAYERRFDAAPQQVWDAYTKPELVRQWLGYGEFTRCEMDVRPGGEIHWEWKLPEHSFGIHGDVLEVDAPRRLVTSEHMTDTEYPPTRNTVEFVPDGNGTILKGLIEYGSQQDRDQAYATGMANGMDDSFTKLDGMLG